MSTLGQKLKTARENLELTQEEAAEQIGIKRPTLANWEIDRVKPDLGTIKMLASFYRLRPEYLLDLDVPTQPRPIITPVAVGEKIKQAREEARLSQAQLAQKIGQTVLAIKYMEKGSRKVMSEQLNDIAGATGKPLSFFMPETDAAPMHLNPRDEFVPTKPIPLAGKITAGGPNLAFQEKLGEIRVSKYLDADFGLTVKGDSMVGAGINPGDIAVCKKARFADHGDIVVALVSGDEATLKYLIKDGDTWLLRAANKKYADIILSPEDDRIQGVLVTIQKKLTNSETAYEEAMKRFRNPQEDWVKVVEEAARYDITPEMAERLIRSFGRLKNGLPDEDDDN